MRLIIQYLWTWEELKTQSPQGSGTVLQTRGTIQMLTDKSATSVIHQTRNSIVRDSRTVKLAIEHLRSRVVARTISTARRVTVVVNIGCS
jgi:hypothetical protein